MNPWRSIMAVSFALRRRLLTHFASLISALATGAAFLAHADAPDEDAYRPHTPTLTFHIAHADAPEDTEAIRVSVQKLASVCKIAFETGAVKVRFDSHVVSYHQVAQAIAEAGTARGKIFDPSLIIFVPAYPQAENAGKVDALFAGKRLNQRVHIEPADKPAGKFLIHFLPLTIDPATTGPQGFNGGHLHHPLSDSPPRGLGLPSQYEGVTEKP